jgi:broad specificity phosphatase PhoE
VTAERVHLVRHGEVNNPDGVLYERLPNFGLTPYGRTLAESALRHVPAGSISALIVSPLQRARESMEPWERATGLTAAVDERVIEPWNEFRGLRLNGGRTLLSRPDLWRHLVNPFRPSWGEPYRDIAARMLAAMRDAVDSVDGGDVVIVSHQLPIWMVQRAMSDKPLAHIPSARRCSLSSVTSFQVHPADFVEFDYREAADIDRAVDSGAV